MKYWGVEGEQAGAGTENESRLPPGCVGAALYFLSNNSRVGWLAELNNKYSGF